MAYSDWSTTAASNATTLGIDIGEGCDAANINNAIREMMAQLASAQLQGFAAGTVMLFKQTAAPTGWTKITSSDDAALRIVSGTVSTGGSVAFISPDDSTWLRVDVDRPDGRGRLSASAARVVVGISNGRWWVRCAPHSPAKW